MMAETTKTNWTIRGKYIIKCNTFQCGFCGHVLDTPAHRCKVGFIDDCMLLLMIMMMKMVMMTMMIMVVVVVVFMMMMVMSMVMMIEY